MTNLKKVLLTLGLIFVVAVVLIVPIPEYHQKALCSLIPEVVSVDSSCGAEGWYLGPSIWMNIKSLWSTKQSANRLVSPISKYNCKVNADCTLGINLNSCCDCPEAVSRKFIDGENWNVYNKNEDYYPQRVGKSASCRNAICQSCPPLLNPVCSNNVCQFNTGGTN